MIIILLSLTSCTANEEKVVTNMPEEQLEENIVEEQNNKDLKTSLGTQELETPQEEVEKESAIPQKEEKKEITVEKGPEEKNEKEEDIKVIDGITYKGYKGPVQGEIKYQEGRPATENSLTRKATGDIESPYKIDLIVTKNFGHDKMFAKSVGLVKDEVGMEVLFRNLDIQTAYGGGFVNAINGLESQFTFFSGSERKKLDWFYWVNGILAPIGVAEYRPQPGDTIWWDYHDWSMTMFIPAVVGSYPQPFKSGFAGKNPGTVIMYTPEFVKKATDLRNSLQEQGVKQIDIAPYDSKVIEKPEKYYILLGPWSDLAENSKLLQDINKKNKLVGVYVQFNEDKIQGLNFKGKTIVQKENGGAIYASAGGIGSTKPVWLVTGLDEKGVNLAVDTLINNPGSIDKCFGVLVTEDQVINIPFQE